MNKDIDSNLEAEAIRECYSLMKQIWESVGRKFPVSEKIFVKNWDKIKPQIYKTIKEVL